MGFLGNPTYAVGKSDTVESRQAQWDTVILRNKYQAVRKGALCTLNAQKIKRSESALERPGERKRFENSMSESCFVRSRKSTTNSLDGKFPVY